MIRATFYGEASATDIHRPSVQAARNGIVDADEQRLRANLGAVAQGDALRTRLIRELDADETRHGQLDAAVATAEDAVTQAHAALVDAVSVLQL